MQLPNDPSKRPMLTRRQLLARAGLLGAAGLSLPAMLGSGIVSASGRRSPRAVPRRRPASGDAGSLVFDNWPSYIDPTEEGLTGTVDRFIEATGIDMTYNENVNDNEEYFAIIQPLLGRGEAVDADLMALTGWMAGRLINLGWLEEIPFDSIPNSANLRDDLVKPAWDSEGKYSLPWQTGITGIAYNLDTTGRDLGSVDDLFDPEWKGKVGMLTEMRDTIGLILLSMGIDTATISSFDDAAPAFDKLEQAKNDGQIRAFTGNDYLADLQSGNFAVCMAWSGDVAQLAVDAPQVKFVIPEAGGHSWADTMLIPKGAKNVEQAAKWMDFVYDPEQAAQITDWVQYISPVKGVQEQMETLDPDLATNALVFPDDETLSRLHTFANLDEDTEAQFDEAFSGIIGA